MVFIANVLVMNGGTTFLIRICRALAERGRRCAVLLLREQYDPDLLAQLAESAEVIHLRDFLRDRGLVFRRHLGVLGAIDWRRLENALRPYGQTCHAMSVFGLMLGFRLAAVYPSYRLTVGIYHQNEFLFHGIPFFFAREARRLFKALPALNLVFFNEPSRTKYGCAFDKDYRGATLVPIGIPMPRLPSKPKPLHAPGFRIVSVGNLLGFKTYNRHMIDVVGQLQKKYPALRYDIYGVGPDEASLRRQIADLGLGERVRLLGALPYSDFEATIIPADLFVGSGTALIEAAALGVPAMIGIESEPAPETYGFLPDANGLAYNENMPEVPRVPMHALVDRLFDDPDFRGRVGAACMLKARDFSIDRTADGFLALEDRAISLPAENLPRIGARHLLSLLALGAADRICGGRLFGDRRDQSY